MTRRWLCLGMALSFCFCSLVCAQLPAAQSEDSVSPDKDKASAPQKATVKDLGGSKRNLTFVSTDKPIYQSGEKVYIRGVILDAANHKPLEPGKDLAATIQIKGPKGDAVFTTGASSQDSVWGCAWDVPPGQAGGEYKIVASYPYSGEAPAERKFEIRAYRAPRLKSQIVFLRDGYGPGDKVNATLDVKRAEGGVPEGARVTVTARVDGIEISGGTTKVDEKGLCAVSFDLPRQIPRGEGTLALVIEDGGVVETASKTIPILLQTVDLQIYPEGGDMVAGFKNRLYIQATQPNGKPADLAGKLICRHSGQPDKAVADFRTVHEGRGRFEFTPGAHDHYFLRISQPSGIKTIYPLPEAKLAGAVIRADKDVYKRGQPISLQVACTDKSFRVTAAKREVEVAHSDVKKDTGAHLRAASFSSVSLPLPAEVDGVLTITVWDKSGVPLAERLVFREPASPLKISITADKKSYVPGDSTKLTIKTTDAQGKPVSAVVGLTVTDDSVLEMVDKREQAPHLPVMVFLEPEVKDLADAQVYMDPANARASIATDLLLGTQGWRRYAVMDLVKFVDENGDQARRMLAMVDKPSPAYWAPGAAQFIGMNAVAFADRSRAILVSDGAKTLAPMAAPQARYEFGQGFRRAPLRKAEAPRDANLFQVEPQVFDERHFAAGRVQHRLENINAHSSAFLGSLPANGGFNTAINGAIARPQHQAYRLRARNSMIGGLGGFYAVVREYAHQVRPDRKPDDRLDFAETLFWNAGVKTDPKTGEGTINFGLNDSVTTFRVFADAFAGSGAIGAANIGIKSIQPFYAEAKLPLEVTAGDKVLLPISLINATAAALNGATLKIDLTGPFKLLGLLKGSEKLGPGDRVRWIQPIEIGFGKGSNSFVLKARAGGYEDNVSRNIVVKPGGFPMEQAFGGILEPGKPVVLKITIEKNVVPDSMLTGSAVYPSPLANMTEALEGMIQEPNGCFEQTSSTSYPLTMAQQYFTTHTGVDPSLVERSKEKLDRGYQKLVSFWCPDRGYEWFGQDPGHEALTAFGLLHFNDMSQVRDVDKNMMATTRAWLLKQKDGQGGFTRKRRALHKWIEDKDCSNAYIMWSLLETGQPAADLKAELDSLKKAADASTNSYVTALAANDFYLAGDKAEAKKLMDRLVALQKPDGSIDNVKSSIVGSGGQALEVEGTALATLAWLRDPAYGTNVEKTMKFLADSCKGGRYGSTQSTVLALRAIVTYDKQRAHPKAPGKVREYIDGQPIGDWIAFDQDTKGALKLPDLSEALSPGQHEVELRMEEGSPMPYALDVKYNALTPESNKDCKLQIKVQMAKAKVAEGASTEANVTVTNKTSEVLPSPVAIIGLPGGLEPRHDQLKELVKKGVVDAYEVLGREVVLYWRTMPEHGKIEIPLSLIAAVPGSYTGPASRSYLYYTDEYKSWVQGLRVEITPKPVSVASNTKNLSQIETGK